VTADPFPAGTSSHVMTALLLATFVVTPLGAHGTVAGASIANKRFGVFASAAREVSVADAL
jgi:hypothetical protein